MIGTRNGSLLISTLTEWKFYCLQAILSSTPSFLFSISFNFLQLLITYFCLLFILLYLPILLYCFPLNFLFYSLHCPLHSTVVSMFKLCEMLKLYHSLQKRLFHQNSWFENEAALGGSYFNWHKRLQVVKLQTSIRWVYWQINKKIQAVTKRNNWT